MVSGPQQRQQRRVHQPDQAVAEVECQPFETQDGGALFGAGDPVEIVADEKGGEKHRRSQQHHGQQPPDRPEKGHPHKAGERDQRENGEVGDRRPVFGQPAGDPGQKKPQQGHCRGNQTENRLRNFDQPIVLAVERDEHPHEVVKEQAGQNDHQGEGCFHKPAAGTEGGPESLENGVAAGRLAAGDGLRAQGNLLDPQYRKERTEGHEQREVEGKAQRHLLGKVNRQPQPGGHLLHQQRIINRRAQAHDADIGQGLGPHLKFQDLAPFVGIALFFERIVGNRLIRTAGGRLGCAAEDPVGHEKGEQEVRIAQGGKAQDRHLNHHQDPADDQQVAPPDDVRQGPGGHLQQHDGHRPDHVEKGKLLQREAEIKEENGENRIVEPGVEKNPEGYEEPDIGNGKRRCGDSPSLNRAGPNSGVRAAPGKGCHLRAA